MAGSKLEDSVALRVEVESSSQETSQKEKAFCFQNILLFPVSPGSVLQYSEPTCYEDAAKGGFDSFLSKLNT